MCSFLFFVPNTLGYTNSDSLKVNLTVAFCNANLICDPEENYISCPSDCEPPPEPPPPEDDDGETGGRKDGKRDDDYIGTSPGGQPQFPESPGQPQVPVVIFNPDLPAGFPISSSDTPHDEVFFNTLNASVVDSKDAIWIFWQTSEGKMIRILRSEASFPIDAFTGGKVVYEGRGNEFYDYNLTPGSTYYYSIFVQQPNGSYSNRQLIIVSISEKEILVEKSQEWCIFGPSFLWCNLMLVLLLLIVLLFTFWRFYVRLFSDKP